MSESKANNSISKSSNSSGGLIAIIGLVIVFAIAIVINFLVGAVGVRIDLTENKVFTLSEGTRNILSRLETPVTITYYVTQDSRVMGPMDKNYARRVEDLLNQYVRNAPVKEIEVVNEAGEYESKKVKMLTVKKLDPEPNTDAEDSAFSDGLQTGPSRETGNEMYFGIAIRSVDSLETIPFIPSRQETLLEYDLSRAISNVHGGKTKKVLVMTGMQVGGGMGMNFQAPPKQPWIFYEQLGKDYEVKTIPSSTTEIPADTSTLIVLHPYDITEEAQFAVDQYLLNGGNVIAMVDPSFFYARAMQPQSPMPGMPPQGGGPAPSSNLDKLFAAWGVTYDPTKALADLDFGTEILRRGNFSPTFLTLNDKAMKGSSNDPMTAMLNHLNMLTPGAFEINPPEGITVDSLVQSSVMNQLVSTADADPTQEGGGERIRKNFQPFNKSRELVVRLSGNFNTAFPEGNPAKKTEEEEKAEGKKDEKDKPKEEEKKEEKDKSLKKSVSPGNVILFADVDFIYDETCVRRTTIPGMNIQSVQALNENLTLMQNAVEQMSGDKDLIKVRSRSSTRRPFSKQMEWMREAEAKYAAELASFEEKKKETEGRLNKIIQANPENFDKALLSSEVQAQLEQLQKDAIESSKKLRDLQKEVKREFRRKQDRYKAFNVLFMPLLVVLFGVGLALARRSRVAAR